MANLAQAIAQFAIDGDDLTIEAPPAWSQGRTLYGGMTAALSFEAAVRQRSPNTPLRSAQFIFTSPAAGTLRFRSDMLRQGRSTAMVGVDCVTDGGLAARAAFAFGAARHSRVEFAQQPRPAIRPPRDCPEFISGTGGFHDNFEMRLGDGTPLFGDGPPGFAVWTRFRDRQDVDGVTALLALADALPPAAMACFPEPAPISTMSWTIDLTCTPAALEGWHLLRSTSEHSGEGYSIQRLDVWDASGAHLASGRQMVAIFI